MQAGSLSWQPDSGRRAVRVPVRYGVEAETAEVCPLHRRAGAGGQSMRLSRRHTVEPTLQAMREEDSLHRWQGAGGRPVCVSDR